MMIFAYQKTVGLVHGTMVKKKKKKKENRKKMPYNFSILKNFIFFIVRETPFHALQKAN